MSGGVTGSDDLAVSHLGSRAHSPCGDAGRGASSGGRGAVGPN